MKTNWKFGWCAVVCLLTLAARADDAPSAEQLKSMAHDSVYGCSRGRGMRIENLRQAGPAGLEALFALRVEMAAKTPSPNLADPDAPEIEKAAALAVFDEHTRRVKILQEVIDAVGGQHDCTVSRLFWHTDLEAAKAAAAKSGKPILSLRMLGKLTDDLSCANSRFFRTTLYANKEVSEVLRTRYILHWKSVRPVPTVTVDFGDGRKLVRTVTGNSIHYVLDHKGRVIDALPGLYGPKAFLDRLAAAESFATLGKGIVLHEEWLAALGKWHDSQLRRLNQNWNRDLASVAGDSGDSRAQLEILEAKSSKQGQQVAQQAAPPRAAAAAYIARPKIAVERPILAAVTPADGALLEAKTSDDLWLKIALLHAGDAELDAASLALIESKTPPANLAGSLAITKSLVESPLVRMLEPLKRAIALDTVKNEYLLHRQIHEWLAAEPEADLDALNERVYAQLFLTPSSDPWLGLLPADAYSAIDNNGVVMHKK